jgi:disulfide bond formation protein DsbB
MTELTTKSITDGSRTGWATLALAVSLLGTAGSLSLSLGLGLKACPLCFYQRSFVMGVFAVLAVGLAVDRSQACLYTVLAIPLAAAGLGIAAFHEYLVLTGVLECPSGLFGIGTAPAQSLTLFACLFTILLIGALSGRSGRGRRAASILGASALGVLLAWGSIASSPPTPPAPTAPYDPVKQPLEMCRPPYRAEA